MLNLSSYQPLCFNNIAPTEWYQCREWHQSFSCHFQWCCISMHMIIILEQWCMPESSLVDHTKVSKLFSKLSDQQAFYSTHAMHQEFLEKYSRLAKVSKMLLQNIYCTLRSDQASASSLAESEVDKRVGKSCCWLGWYRHCPWFAPSKWFSKVNHLWHFLGWTAGLF